jgi:hypothetical protein
VRAFGILLEQQRANQMTIRPAHELSALALFGGDDAPAGGDGDGLL